MSVEYIQKFDGNLGFESKDLNLSKPILVKLNKVLSGFTGGLNTADPTNARDENQEYQDYIEFLESNTTVVDILKKHFKYNLHAVLHILDTAMEGNTNLHNKTARLKKQLNDTNESYAQWLQEKQQLTNDWKISVEENNRKTTFGKGKRTLDGREERFRERQTIVGTTERST